MRVREVTAGPLFEPAGSRARRIARRVRGITAELVGFAAVTVLFPVLLIAALAVDLSLWIARRKPWIGWRLVLFLWWFLFGEVRALATILWIWVSTGGPFGRGSLRRSAMLYSLRIRWASSHLGGISALFRLRFEVEGLEAAGPGPVLVMMRHASIIDNMLPDTTIGKHFGIGLRFVIKRELELIPAIDIGARWVPTYFAMRGASDTAGETAFLRRLPEGIGPGEGLMIYPEGTRFTPAKLARAQEIIAERRPEISHLANRLENLLPPRLGGPLTLLDVPETGDVVFCGHVGFDGFQYISDIWAGKLVCSTIRIRFWRHDRASIPDGEQARTEWLYERWQEMDDWIGSHRAGAAAD